MVSKTVSPTPRKRSQTDLNVESEINEESGLHRFNSSGAKGEQRGCENEIGSVSMVV